MLLNKTKRNSIKLAQLAFELFSLSLKLSCVVTCDDLLCIYPGIRIFYLLQDKLGEPRKQNRQV